MLSPACGEREGLVHWLIAVLVRRSAALFGVWARPLVHSLNIWQMVPRSFPVCSDPAAVLSVLKRRVAAVGVQSGPSG